MHLKNSFYLLMHNLQEKSLSSYSIKNIGIKKFISLHKFFLLYPCILNEIESKNDV